VTDVVGEPHKVLHQAEELSELTCPSPILRRVSIAHGASGKLHSARKFSRGPPASRESLGCDSRLGDLPKIPLRVPRFIPEHELARLMDAIRLLKCPYQHAALLIARWSCARRDEVRRLALEVLTPTAPRGYAFLRVKPSVNGWCC
jgi:hypothetical protein